MRVEILQCLNCQRAIPSRFRFCAHCGGNQADLKEHFEFTAQSPHSEETKRAEANIQDIKAIPAVENAPPKLPEAEKPKSSKKVFVFAGIGIAALVIVIAALGSSSTTSTPSTIATSSSKPASSPSATKITVAFDPSYFPAKGSDLESSTCEALKGGVVDLEFLPRTAEKIAAEVDSISTSSKAKTYISENRSWVETPLVVSFQNYLRALVKSQSALNISQLGYDSNQYTVDRVSWLEAYAETAIEVCGISNSVKEVESQINDFQKEVDKVIKLAK